MEEFQLRDELNNIEGHSNVMKVDSSVLMSKTTNQLSILKVHANRIVSSQDQFIQEI